METRLENLEERVRAVEKELAANTALLATNLQTLNALQEKIDRPKNYTGIITSTLSVLAVLGALTYAGYIRPIEMRMRYLEEQSLVLHSAVDEVEDEVDMIQNRYGLNLGPGALDDDRSL